MSTSSFLRIAIACGTLAAATTGCTGYRLGSSLPPDIRTVAVPGLVNQTDEPLIEVETTRQVLAALIRDGALKVVPEAEADVILRATLTRFNLTPIAFDAERTTRTDEFRMTLTASMDLVRRESGEVVVRARHVNGRTDFLLTGDLTSAKRTALPAAAADLAQSLVDQIVQAWPTQP